MIGILYQYLTALQLFFYRSFHFLSFLTPSFFCQPLLPVFGTTPLLTEWLEAVADCRAHNSPSARIANMFIVTNGLHYDQYVSWASSVGFPLSDIINDGTMCNADRLGAVGVIGLVLSLRASAIAGTDLVVIAGDTLFSDDFNLFRFLSLRDPACDHVLYYTVGSDAEVRKRGIIELNAAGIVTSFLEKPDPSATTSRFACPAFYVLRSSTLPLIATFLSERADAPLDQRDAPGTLIQYLVSRRTIRASPVSSRHDIGGLAEYRQARSPHHVRERAFARIGVMGNPSDGFNGRTLSASIQNFYATVRIRPSARLVIVPHPTYDVHEFDGLDQLAKKTDVSGYYGGLRLIRATCKRFIEMAARGGVEIPKRNFTISYDSNIPFGTNKNRGRKEEEEEEGKEEEKGMNMG